jgi:UPF0755 protein
MQIMIKYFFSKSICSKYGFKMVAGKMSYPLMWNQVGFLLTKGMNSYELVKAMRSNVPVKLALTIKNVVKFSRRVGSQIEADSVLNSFKDSIF